jgi:aminoglycoside phosphotransferase (APT) family kinase protein
MEQLAVFHIVMEEFPAEHTRTRMFPPADWLSQRLTETWQFASDAEDELVNLLSKLANVLAGNLFAEPFTCQHVLIDCHPGQFLFSDGRFTGIVDFDHVATAYRLRDLSKLLSTDSLTLSRAPNLIASYLSIGDISLKQRRYLPAGILRYILASCIQKTHNALSEDRSAQAARALLHTNLQAFSGVLPDLRSALGVDTTPGVPASLTVG